ncbi:MAG TPA: copper-translocating P-type ATPase, partial [Methylomirabilota bacterium]|nr:copper-translocating P-type ATPase [Methylomirabilota bacterium]
YAAQPFFGSAVAAIRRRSVNMDVPISIGILLATGLSVVNTFTHAHEAYFDSALMLLFFLLLGRFLDENMRRRTAMEAETLATLRSDSAVRVGADGALTEVPVSRIQAGDIVLVRPGERVPVDGRIAAGSSEIDRSLVTGETTPVHVVAGEMVHAGMINGFGALTVQVTAAVEGTLLAEIERLIGEAQSTKAGALRLADRAARAYAPVVHSAAALSFAGWMMVGADWSYALVIAIAVLIITCPCALALAIPAVQVVAAGRLFRNGILLNSGDAIERLAAVDTIVFDKTGTLTTPDPRLVAASDGDASRLSRAGRLALASRHPLAKALARAAGAVEPYPGAREHAGEGVCVEVEGREMRLGSPVFAGVSGHAVADLRALHPTASLIAFADGAGEPVVYAMAQTLKSDALETVRRLEARGYRIEILSGDRAPAVEAVARALGVANFQAEIDPAGKIERLQALAAAEGRTVLMVGDGLNDAPSLAAAHVSLSPVSAAHVAQAAADAVFLGDRLAPVAMALGVSRAARRLMMQNLAIAVVYNAIAVPIAVLGCVTPLVAAAAMSGSSLIVTVNAVRLRQLVKNPRETAEKAGARPVAIRPEVAR